MGGRKPEVARRFAELPLLKFIAAFHCTVEVSAQLFHISSLGGVFYSVDMLPDIWQTVSLGNPILYMINAFRYGLIGVTDVDVTIAFVMTGGFSIILILFSLFLLHKGVGIKN